MNLREKRFETHYRLFAVCAPAVVSAGGDRVPHHGIADHEADAGGNRNHFMLERAAVEQNSTVRGSVARGKLVHDAATRSYKFIFGARCGIMDQFAACNALLQIHFRLADKPKRAASNPLVAGQWS